MKILLLTDIPPTKSYTAGIFLENILRHIPKEHVVCCYTVLNRHLMPAPSDEYKEIPLKVITKPRENWGNHKYGSLISYFFETAIKSFTIPAIVNDISKFGKNHEVDSLWVTLQGQTMIRLALPVARSLGIPLYPLVYDPPEWWMRANKVNKFIAKKVITEFGNTLNRSRNCALASWAMVEYYSQLYGAKGVPMVSCLDADVAKAPASEYTSQDEFIICMAGQLYARDEWHALLEALDSIDWQVNGKNIRLRYMGEWLEIGAKRRRCIEYLGWRTLEEVIDIASNSDLCYCPYWFSPEFELESKLSFPSKLPLYFASGRPVLFHGPEYSSPGKFITKNSAAYVCHSLNADDLVIALSKIAEEKTMYQRVAQNAHHAFNAYLTHDQMKERVREFFGFQAFSST